MPTMNYSQYPAIATDKSFGNDTAPSYGAGGIEEQAGYTSLMTEGNPTGDVYYRTVDELTAQGYAATTRGVNSALRDDDTERMVSMLPDILASDDHSEEFKESAVKAAFDDERPDTPLTAQYSRELLEEPEISENSVERSFQRNGALEAFRISNEYRAAAQGALDDAGYGPDSEVVIHAADLALSFVPYVEQSQALHMQELAEEGPGALVSWALLGEGKEAVFNTWKKMPVEERTSNIDKWAKTIVEAYSIGGYTNDMITRAELHTLLFDQYDAWDRGLDNTFSLLDSTALLAPVARFFKGAKAAKTVAMADSVRSPVRKNSPLRVASEANATVAKKQVKEILDDGTDETAKALTGTSRTEAVADAVLPEVKVSGKGLRSKVGSPLADVDRATITNPELAKSVELAHVGVYTAQEVKAATAKHVNRLQSVTGVTARPESFVVESTEQGGRVSAMYGPKEGGYAIAQEGVDLVHLATRNHGINKEDIFVMGKNPQGEYVRLENIPEEKGDYLIGIEHDYEVFQSDLMGRMDKFPVRMNFLDRIPMASSISLNRYIFPPSATLDPHLTTMANASVDLEAKILKTLHQDAKVYTEKVRKLSPDAQRGVTSYVEYANEVGEDFNAGILRDEWGFSESQIDAVKSFRDYWDNVYAVRNRLHAKELADQGYMVLESAEFDTRIFGKPRRAQDVDINAKFFNVESEDIVRMTREDLQKHYEAGGSVIQMRKPMMHGDDVATYTLINKSDNFRRVTKEDVVYPYRKGYYEVEYDAPHFIIETRNVGGTEVSRAVATAGNMADAELYVARMGRENSKAKYHVRADVKDPSERRGLQRDTYETYGRTSSRTRGKRLEDATAVVRNTEQSNIKGPVDSMIDVARSLSTKVALGDYINATKKRFTDQYKNVLPKENGQTKYPNSVDDIAGGMTREVADARTTYEFISSLENGYVSTLDNFFKGMFRAAAEFIGEKGFGTAERFLRKASDFNPSDFIKSAGIQLYLTLNPLRQALLNAHQSVLLTSTHLRYVSDPRGLVADISAITDLHMSGGKLTGKLAKLTHRSEAELKLMYKELRNSGLLDSIDANNMVRGSLVEFAESHTLKGNLGARSLSKAMTGIRKIGFDSGEYVNITTAWLAHYNDAAKAAKAEGRALTATDFKKLAGQTRTYTMDMNRAGEMPYNRGSLSVIFQFAQVPHKALMQLANRNLTGKDRLRLGAYNALAFTFPPAAMYQYFGSILPDRDKHPELHEMVVQGLEFYLVNKLIEVSTGEESKIDLSGLTPLEANGLVELLHGMVSLDLVEMFESSPSGSLFVGSNPRITNFLKTTGRYLGFIEDFEYSPTELNDVFMEFANMSSGFGNAYKAKMALRYEKAFNAQGAVTDAKVSTPEAYAKALGFRTMDEVRSQFIGNEDYNTKQSIMKDVDRLYKELARKLTREELSAQDQNRISMMTSEGVKAFKDNPKAFQRWMFNLQRDMEKGIDSSMMAQLIKQSGYTPLTEMRARLNSAPDMDDAQRETLLDMFDILENLNNEAE